MVMCYHSKKYCVAYIREISVWASSIIQLAIVHKKSEGPEISVNLLFGSYYSLLNSTILFNRCNGTFFQCENGNKKAVDMPVLLRVIECTVVYVCGHVL